MLILSFHDLTFWHCPGYITITLHTLVMLHAEGSVAPLTGNKIRRLSLRRLEHHFRHILKTPYKWAVKP